MTTNVTDVAHDFIPSNHHGAHYAIVAPMLSGKSTLSRAEPDHPDWLDSDDAIDYDALSVEFGKPTVDWTPQQWRDRDARRIEMVSAFLAAKTPRPRILLVHGPKFADALGYRPIAKVIIPHDEFLRRQALEPDRAEMAAFNRSQAIKHDLPLYTSLEAALDAVRAYVHGIDEED